MGLYPAMPCGLGMLSCSGDASWLLSSCISRRRFAKASCGEFGLNCSAGTVSPRFAARGAAGAVALLEDLICLWSDISKRYEYYEYLCER